MLYKYLPPERVDVIESCRIRFTQLLSLNDPFEHCLLIGRHEYALSEKESGDITRFVSLSRNNSNLLMWSHYADSHKGFCIGFTKNDNYFKKALSVRYRRFRSSFNGADMNITKSINITKQIALEKAIDWAYEEEERLFIDDVKLDALKGGTDVWGRDILLNSFPRQSISAIYLGLRASSELEFAVTQAVMKHELNIQIFKARRSTSEFGISFEYVSGRYLNGQ
ncbi:DUF2971 domain-containing protein [Pseudomonas fragi]|uniref:DUF2971 domain-containing protein n=1 Tax=Pseudomonas fragi TaxID=296 RepID=A0A9Q5B6M9_PSEFR|nr:DUF2971 domain-containing protein [Pseudomonas fragi]